jgi:hypothetical protein
MSFTMHTPLGDELQEIRVPMGDGHVAVFRGLWLESFEYTHDPIEVTSYDGFKIHINGSSRGELRLMATMASIERAGVEDVKGVRVIRIMKKD